MSRVFLDENVNARLAKLLPDHVVADAIGLGLGGFSNGALLKQIENDFDVLITHDRNMQFQHNWRTKRLCLIILRTNGNSIKHYQPVLERIIAAIQASEPGKVLEVPTD